MRKQTLEQIVQEMEGSGIFMKKKMTAQEYREQLLQFQELVGRMVMEEQYTEGMRIEKTMNRLQGLAEERGLCGDQRIRKGLEALAEVKRELAICMSGRIGEDLTNQALEHISRPGTSVYRNIYVSDGYQETELDYVVVTDRGVLILEVKRIVGDVHLTEDGNLICENGQDYIEKPIQKRMILKRKLLREKLEHELNLAGENLHVCVDSYLVFSRAKALRIEVLDELKTEKWCFRNGIAYKINGYLGSVRYTDQQMESLNRILKKMEKQVKRFCVTVDFDVIRKSFAEMMEALTQGEDFGPDRKDRERDISERIREMLVAEILDIVEDLRTEKKKSAVMTCAALLGTILASSKCKHKLYLWLNK